MRGEDRQAEQAGQARDEQRSADVQRRGPLDARRTDEQRARDEAGADHGLEGADDEAATRCRRGLGDVGLRRHPAQTAETAEHGGGEEPGVEAGGHSDRGDGEERRAAGQRVGRAQADPPRERRRERRDEEDRTVERGAEKADDPGRFAARREAQGHERHQHQHGVQFAECGDEQSRERQALAACQTQWRFE